MSDSVREGEQLDFKAELYGNSDSERRELAGDLAAFANHRGGLLILGVGEEDGAAASLPLVDLTDAQERRIHQIVAGNVFPHLPIELFPVTVEDDSRGVLIVAVGPSPLRPHGVVVNDALRYPRRQGTVTRYLSESEVADLYRDRFAVQRDEVERVAANRREAIEQIDEDGGVWVAVSMVPTGSGSLTINEQMVKETEEWAKRFIGHDYVGGFLGNAAPRVRPGLRRLGLVSNYGYDSPPNFQYADLHTDGSAVALIRISDARRERPEGEPFPVLNIPLVWTTATALSVVAAHALRVGAWGEALVQLTIFGPPRVLTWLSLAHFVERMEGARTLDGDVASQHTFALSDLTAEMQRLLAATRVLLTDVFNAFGVPEVRALTPSGAINRRHVNVDQQLAAWAQQQGVATEAS